MNIFKNGDFLHIEFSNGEVYDSHEQSAEDWEFILENKDDENVIYDRFMIQKEGIITPEMIKRSNVLKLRGASVYMKDVSEISIPNDFVAKILEAENNGDEVALQTYINFWKLVSLNPDARVRNNMFWFIRKWDMRINKSGLIVAYRNAVLKNSVLSTEEVKDILNSYYKVKYVEKEDPNDIDWDDNGRTLQDYYNQILNDTDESPVYTDMHSHTTTIKLGHPVSIPREDCDAEQENSCSRGLHVGAKGWLKENYYGGVGLQVLVNPANVVAVPTIDEYGKMRCCEYFPINIIDFDEFGNVIEPEYDLDDDIIYLSKYDYEGEVNNEDIDNYTINTKMSREDIYESILEGLAESYQ